jgi:hypothetical protein
VHRRLSGDVRAIARQANQSFSASIALLKNSDAISLRFARVRSPTRRMLESGCTPSASASSPIRSPAGSGAAQKANSGGLCQLELWTGTPPEGSGTFSPEPIFSEPMDSANLVQRFEGLRDSAF